MRAVVIGFALVAAAAAAAGQTWSCSIRPAGPINIQPGQSVTLTYTATYSGSTPLHTTGTGDSLAMVLGIFFTSPTDSNQIIPHVHVTRPIPSDSQISACSPVTNSTSVAGVCSQFFATPATINPGATESMTMTLSVDAGPWAAAADVSGSIFSGNSDLCFSGVVPLTVGSSCNLIPSGPAIAQSNQPYTIEWNAAIPTPPNYSIDESTSADFSANLRTQTPGSPKQTFQHSAGSPTAFYYRVRTGDCGGGTPGPYSPVIRVVVQGTPAPVSGAADVVVPIGSTAPVSVPVSVSVPPGASFTATADRPFLTVSPASGTASSSGTLLLNVTGDPSKLSPGANTGTVIVTWTGATGEVTIASGGTLSVPISISIVTPVSPGTLSGSPAPNTLILPVITHVNGAAAIFQSDVRLSNVSGADLSYLLLLTPTLINGTQSGFQTTLPLRNGQTIAMNDIAKDFFGYGATGDPSDQGFGSLQLIPLNTSTLLSFASSRTYATTAAGTFGQFIPATPLASFATKGQLLSLQHVAQSDAFRTNLGLVEGSGVAATGTVRIIDDNGTLLQTVPYSLQPGEHEQLNGFIAANGVAKLADGRFEVTVDSPGGAVTAYASVLDNTTNDPYAVAPVRIADVAERRYVTPGIADLNNGAANFHSDLRIFNGGPTSQTVTLTYYPQGAPGSPVTAAAVTIGPGQIFAKDNVLPSLFGVSNSGGSVLASTTAPSSLVATGRTYSNAAAGGSFGQFIPGISPAEGTGMGGRPLQILQLEQSSAFRSNIGVVELTGNPAHVRLSLSLPDSKVTPSIEFDLAPNEFRQLPMSALNPPDANTYNARMTVEVTSGAGRVTAYGSVIDNRTQDPTYVPAQ